MADGIPADPAAVRNDGQDHRCMRRLAGRAVERQAMLVERLATPEGERLCAAMLCFAMCCPQLAPDAEPVETVEDECDNSPLEDERDAKKISHQGSELLGVDNDSGETWNEVHDGAKQAPIKASRSPSPAPRHAAPNPDLDLDATSDPVPTPARPVSETMCFMDCQPARFCDALRHNPWIFCGEGFFFTLGKSPTIIMIDGSIQYHGARSPITWLHSASIFAE